MWLNSDHQRLSLSVLDKDFKRGQYHCLCHDRSSGPRREPGTNERRLLSGRLIISIIESINYPSPELVVMDLPFSVKIQEDAIASIKTRGLIGDKFIEITPGGSEELIGPGGKIRDTQSAVDLEELISNYVFGKL